MNYPRPRPPRDQRFQAQYQDQLPFYHLYPTLPSSGYPMSLNYSKSIYLEKNVNVAQAKKAQSSQQTASTTPVTSPDTYAKPLGPTSDASTKAMDMFPIDILESQATNHITSFLKSLTCPIDLKSQQEQRISLNPSKKSIMLKPANQTTG